MNKNNYHELFTKRNISMADSILKQKPNAFCVVEQDILWKQWNF